MGEYFTTNDTEISYGDMNCNFWLKIESSVWCFLVASNCSWLIEVNAHSSDLLNVSIFANGYYSWVDFEPTLSNDTKAQACGFALSLTTGNLESWFWYMDTHFPLLYDAVCRQRLWCGLIWQTRILPMLKYFFFVAQQLLGDQGLLIIKATRLHWVRHTILGRTPLDEWSARHRGLYLTIHNTNKRQTSMIPAVFEPTIPTGERP